MTKREELIRALVSKAQAAGKIDEAGAKLIVEKALGIGEVVADDVAYDQVLQTLRGLKV